MGPSLQLGRIFGIPVEVNISWILVFLLLTYLLAGEFEDARLRWPMAQRWSVAMITVVLFFLSVLLHELSHSVMALSKGIPVRCITLFIFGGVSRLDKEPERPLIEFMVAAVGPLMSLALAAVLGGIWFLMGRGDSPVEVALVLLMWTNLSLGVFNLVPGYPLDGGRLLRAGIWGLTGNHRKATRISSGMGLLVGGGMLLGGIVGAFLFSMAKSSFPK